MHTFALRRLRVRGGQKQNRSNGLQLNSAVVVITIGLYLLSSLTAVSNPYKYSYFIDTCCRLIINDCLDSGTQIPYITRALDQDWAVLVTNTNDNSPNEVMHSFTSMYYLLHLSF